MVLSGGGGRLTRAADKLFSDSWPEGQINIADP